MIISREYKGENVTIKLTKEELKEAFEKYAKSELKVNNIDVIRNIIKNII